MTEPQQPLLKSFLTSVDLVWFIRTVQFKAGLYGNIQVGYGIGLCIKDKRVEGAIIPEAWLEAVGELAVNIVIAKGGVRVTAVVLQTVFLPRLILTLSEDKKIGVCLEITVSRLSPLPTPSAGSRV